METATHYDALGRTTSVWKYSRSTSSLANETYTYALSNTSTPWVAHGRRRPGTCRLGLRRGQPRHLLRPNRPGERLASQLLPVRPGELLEEGPKVQKKVAYDPKTGQADYRRGTVVSTGTAASISCHSQEGGRHARVGEHEAQV
ncbi:hypothetical protein [Streptomyces griseorubiginosus]|uniref:hypothetical protein n=1 Tax=Streptomyces griseorubiginosus TaxID=67304 RepID=UPI003658E67F